jgi:hypothetical protein
MGGGGGHGCGCALAATRGGWGGSSRAAASWQAHAACMGAAVTQVGGAVDEGWEAMVPPWQRITRTLPGSGGSRPLGSSSSTLASQAAAGGCCEHCTTTLSHPSPPSLSSTRQEAHIHEGRAATATGGRGGRGVDDHLTRCRLPPPLFPCPLTGPSPTTRPGPSTQAPVVLVMVVGSI